MMFSILINKQSAFDVSKQRSVRGKAGRKCKKKFARIMINKTVDCMLSYISVTVLQLALLLLLLLVLLCEVLAPPTC
jgi:hypothetical protein